MGNFINKKTTDGEHYFNLMADDLQILLTSQVFSSKSECLNRIESVRHFCSDRTMYELRQSDDRKHYFVMKTPDGEVIGKSELYDTNAGLDNGIEAVKKNGKSTTIEEEEPYF